MSRRRGVRKPSGGANEHSRRPLRHPTSTHPGSHETLEFDGSRDLDSHQGPANSSLDSPRQKILEDGLHDLRGGTAGGEQDTPSGQLPRAAMVTVAIPKARIPSAHVGSLAACLVRCWPHSPLRWAIAAYVVALPIACSRQSVSIDLSSSPTAAIGYLLVPIVGMIVALRYAGMGYAFGLLLLATRTKQRKHVLVGAV